MSQELLNIIRLSLLKGVGPVNAKKLVAYCGSVEGVFSETTSNLKKIPNLGPHLISQIKSTSTLSRAHEELAFIEKNKLCCCSYLDDQYPQELKHCFDAPILLYTKGNIDFNKTKTISIVGSRNASSFGISFCRELIKELSPYSPIIVSGLAYGIDTCAHKSAISNGLPILAVLAHGFETIYPSQNRELATQLLEKGGLLTEFMSQTKIIKQNFVRRNRIIAGLSQATIVIESKTNGGAMLTARMANSYNREVFAVPSKPSDKYASGCLELIKQNEAHLLQSVDDIIEGLSWDVNAKVVQKTLFELENEEKQLVSLISQHNGIHIDRIHSLSHLSYSKTNEVLMNLELKGALIVKPGKLYFV